MFYFTFDVSWKNAMFGCVQAHWFYFHCHNTTLTFKLLMIFFYKPCQAWYLVYFVYHCSSFSCHLDTASCHVRESHLRDYLNHITLGPWLWGISWLIIDGWGTSLLLVVPSVGRWSWVFKKANCMRARGQANKKLSSTVSVPVSAPEVPQYWSVTGKCKLK